MDKKLLIEDIHELTQEMDSVIIRSERLAQHALSVKSNLVTFARQLEIDK